MRTSYNDYNYVSAFPGAFTYYTLCLLGFFLTKSAELLVALPTYFAELLLYLTIKSPGALAYLTFKTLQVISDVLRWTVCLIAIPALCAIIATPCAFLIGCFDSSGSDELLDTEALSNNTQALFLDYGFFMPAGKLSSSDIKKNSVQAIDDRDVIESEKSPRQESSLSIADFNLNDYSDSDSGYDTCSEWEKEDCASPTFFN